MGLLARLKGCIRAPVEACAAKFGEHTRSSKEPRLWILMYHRILPQTDDRYHSEEPGMVVTPESLRMHINVLQQYFTIVKLSDWIIDFSSGKSLPQKAVALTFDDGWLDNYEYAFPVLQQTQCPATVFLVSHMIGTNLEFWPNRVAKLLQLPSRTLQTIDWLKPYTQENSLTREQQAAAIYQLKSLPDSEIIALLDETEARLELKQNSPPNLMSWQQVRTMQDSGVIEFGSHTKRHIRLRNGIDFAVAEEEISQSKQLIEQKLGSASNIFCYPNGDHCPPAVQLVEQYYQAAVTTSKGIVTPSPELKLASLNRIALHEDTANTPNKFLARLSNWPKL